MNLFLLCHANEQTLIFLQQILRHMVLVLSPALLERYKNSIGQNVQKNYIQFLDSICVIPNWRID